MAKKWEQTMRVGGQKKRRERKKTEERRTIQERQPRRTSVTPMSCCREALGSQKQPGINRRNTSIVQKSEIGRSFFFFVCRS